VAHRGAKLTPFGRLLICERVLDLGWTVAEAAKAAGVSRATAYKWARRYLEEGLPGLEDRSLRAGRFPHALPPSQVHRHPSGSPPIQAGLAPARLCRRVAEAQCS
jgi:transposase-like protein